jgi:hypothetical protein
MRRIHGGGAARCLAVAALFVVPISFGDAAHAQGVRGTLGSTTRYVELRPLRLDTIPIEQATQRADGTWIHQNAVVACDSVVCTLYGTGPLQHSLAATHDANFTAWGFGVEGLSATAVLRARSHLSGEFRLPHADIEAEALLAYAELVRARYRLRVGRQRELSGLGFSGFDGVDVLVEPARLVRVQLYGGRSLARAVQQPLGRAFQDVEERDFVRDRDAILVGGEAGLETRAGDMLALRFQGEIWADRAGLLSERALLVGRTVALAPLTLNGSVEYDVGFGRWGKAHLDARYPLFPALAVEARLRRHVPFFEYWTIWGLFSPVAYHEAELRASWTPRTSLGGWAAGSYRRYAPHHTQLFGSALETESVSALAGAAWRPSERLALDASLRAEGPVGAFSYGADAAVDWRASPRVQLSAHALLADQLQEFRVGAAALAGAGVSFDVRLMPELRAGGGVSAYRQLRADRPGGLDWTQRRGWAALHWDIGRDPGGSP